MSLIISQRIREDSGKPKNLLSLPLEFRCDNLWSLLTRRFKNTPFSPAQQNKARNKWKKSLSTEPTIYFLATGFENSNTFNETNLEKNHRRIYPQKTLSKTKVIWYESDTTGEGISCHQVMDVSR